MNFNYLDPEDLQFLEKIIPFPGIEDRLKEIIANNNFKGGEFPFLDIHVTPTKYSDTSIEQSQEWHLFRIGVLEPRVSLFETLFNVRMMFWSSSPENSNAYDYLPYSKFERYFEYNKVRASASLAMDTLTAAQLITYYLQSFGFSDINQIKTERNMSFSSGDLTKMNFQNPITVPDTFRRAVAKVKDLRIDYCDFVYLRISGLLQNNTTKSLSIHSYTDYDEDEDCDYLSFCYSNESIEKSDVENRRYYQNFECMNFGIRGDSYYEEIYLLDDDLEQTMRFFTDYFLFLNPDIKADDIVVSLDYSSAKDFDSKLEDCCVQDKESSDWLFSFYPDGTEDSPEKLKFLTAKLEKLWKATIKAEEEEAKKYANIESYEEPPIGKQIGIFLATPLSEAIQEAHSCLDELDKEVYFYDTEDRLVMTMSKQDLTNQYTQKSDIKTVCTFYLTPEKGQLFDTLYFGTRHQRYEYESSQEGISVHTVCLQPDTPLASHYISYWLTSLGFDPSSLHIHPSPSQYGSRTSPSATPRDIQ